MKIEARLRDLGGFSVRRVLPYAKRRMVGPFIFLDHMGPMNLDATHAMDVRPHPHIGLATFTYLYEGIGFHRDTIGSELKLMPGAVNWMIAGRGIAHSERSPKEERVPGHHLHGIQIWVALPTSHEEMEPEFHHHPESDLPEFFYGQSRARLLIGEYQGQRSKVKTMMRTLAMDLQVTGGESFELPAGEQEIGIYVSQGEMQINGERISEGTMLVIDRATQSDGGDRITAGKVRIESKSGGRAMLVGGDPYPEPRHIWWNFVSSRPERIREAAALWEKDGFGHIPNEHERIPLPKDPLP